MSATPIVGIRREGKSRWERRSPLAPAHVKALVAQGLKVLVQPSTIRVYHDSKYEEVRYTGVKSKHLPIAHLFRPRKRLKNEHEGRTNEGKVATRKHSLFLSMQETDRTAVALK